MTFEDYYRKYFTPLTYYAYKFLKDHDRAKDIVQDVFRRAWQGVVIKENIGNEPLCKSYLYGGVRNGCLNVINQERTFSDISTANDIEAPNSELNNFIEMEFYVKLYPFINALPPECKRIIKLYYQHGFTSGQIAAMLGLRKSTVKTQMVRGVAIIKKMLANPTKQNNKREPAPKHPVPIKQLYAVIYHFRHISKMKLREVSEVIGIEPFTIHKMEHRFTKACQNYLSSDAK